MAASNSKEYPLGSPLVHIKMCEFHRSPIDMICEDCDKFICAKCAKIYHRDHEWNTISTAASEKRRGLLKFLKKVKEKDLHLIDEMIAKTSKQKIENKELCDYEVKRLQKHCDEIIAWVTEIKKYHEKKLGDNLMKKNDQLNLVKSMLDEKKRGIVDIVEFIEENNSTISDYGLIDIQRELTKMLSELEVHTINCEHSVRFSRGEINDGLFESLVGKTLDLDDIGLTQINSFQYGNKEIFMLETLSEDQCYINEFKSIFTGKVNKEGKKNQFFVITPYHMCVTQNGNVYFTDFSNNAISCLSPSGSISSVISTNPLEPMGICNSVDGDLLVTLRDNESDQSMLEFKSRCLVRHITVTGDVIHEYEYQEDGQTRLFTLPETVTQNSNHDICVLNRRSENAGDLVILFPSGHIKSAYHGLDLAEDFDPTDVVCDSLCNILVTDSNNNQIHLLNPDGEFLKFLLTENDINRPLSLSLCKSTLWVGSAEGLVKVFQYRM